MRNENKLQERRTLKRNLTGIFCVVASVNDYCVIALKTYLTF